MGLFGQGTGSIANCAQCLNKAEVRIYPNDNPDPICEDCYRDNQKLEQKISDKSEEVRKESQVNHQSVNPYSQSGSERDQYIDTICRMASDEWVRKFTKDIKRILINDWKTIIRNERWFSLLELRRFALEVNPEMDKPKPVQQGFKLIQEDLPQPVIRVRRGRKQKAKEPIHA